MKLGLLSSSVMFATFALAGCQHQDAAPPVAPTPPSVTSAPVAPPPPPPMPPTGGLGPGQLGGGPMSGPPPGSLHGFAHHGGPAGHSTSADTHVYKFDFVLTPKDPKDTTLTPTSFSVSIADHNSGEVRIGKNVALTPAPPPPSADKNAPHLGGVSRQDIGLKVEAHPQSIDDSTDILVDVELELSSIESGGSIRKLTSRGSIIASPGKSTPVVSLDDDKRHYDLVVTATKIR